MRSVRVSILHGYGPRRKADMKPILRSTSRRSPRSRRLFRTLITGGAITAIGALCAWQLGAQAAPSTVVTAASAPTTSAASKASSTTAVPLAPTKPFCDLLNTYIEQVRRITISLTDPAAVGPLHNSAMPAVAQSESLAIGRATQDVASVKTALADLKAGFEGAGYDVAKLPAGLLLRLQTPDFMASFARLDAMAKGAC